MSRSRLVAGQVTVVNMFYLPFATFRLLGVQLHRLREHVALQIATLVSNGVNLLQNLI